MYDIEVIEGRNYAVISEGSPAYEFLKAMNSKLVMKKLASEPGEEIFLTIGEMVRLNSTFKRADYKRLTDVDLIKYNIHRDWSGMQVTEIDQYSFTEFGLEIMKDLKTYGGDIEIRLN